MKEMIKSKRIIVTVLSLIAVLLCSTGLWTMARLTDKTEVLTNTFELGEVTTKIYEEFDKVTNTTFKKTPYVINIGENDCYVRVRITASPVDALAILEKNLGEEEGLWTEGTDGYFYYNGVLKVGEMTQTSVFEKVEVVDTTIDEFEVTVYQEAVQAEVYAKDGTSTTDMMTIWAAYESNMIPESFKN